jgi:hypothetical protein
MVVAIVGVAGLGAGLRWVTLKADAPYTTYVDEWGTLKASARQISDATWDPGVYTYPSFLMDATTVTASALAAVRGDSDELRDGARATVATPYIEIVEPWTLVIAGRLVVLALATTNIVLVALLGTRLAGRRVGLLAAFFVAVLPIFVTRGSVVIVDTPAAAFATAALHCCARVVTASSRRQLVTCSSSVPARVGSRSRPRHDRHGAAGGLCHRGASAGSLRVGPVETGRSGGRSVRV